MVEASSSGMFCCSWYKNNANNCIWRFLFSKRWEKNERIPQSAISELSILPESKPFNCKVVLVQRENHYHSHHWSKYENYSCVGDQIRTHKRSEPKINIGKATRETEKNRGIFANTMDRIPTKISIPLPKI